MKFVWADWRASNTQLQQNIVKWQRLPTPVESLRSVFPQLQSSGTPRTYFLCGPGQGHLNVLVIKPMTCWTMCFCLGQQQKCVLFGVLEDRNWKHWYTWARDADRSETLQRILTMTQLLRSWQIGTPKKHEIRLRFFLMVIQLRFQSPISGIFLELDFPDLKITEVVSWPRPPRTQINHHQRLH